MLDETLRTPKVTSPVTPKVQSTKKSVTSSVKQQKKATVVGRARTLSSRSLPREEAAKLRPKLDLPPLDPDFIAETLVKNAIPILDFGLAKALLPAGETSVLPTLAAKLGQMFSGGAAPVQPGLPPISPSAHGITNPANFLAGASFNFLTPLVMPHLMEPAPAGLMKSTEPSMFDTPPDEPLIRNIQPTAPNLSFWR